MPRMQATHNEHPTLHPMPSSMESEQEQEANALPRRLRITRQTSQRHHHPLLDMWQTLQAR
jgi:hypothetical protein